MVWSIFTRKYTPSRIIISPYVSNTLHYQLDTFMNSLILRKSDQKINNLKSNLFMWSKILYLVPYLNVILSTSVVSTYIHLRILYIVIRLSSTSITCLGTYNLRTFYHVILPLLQASYHLLIVFQSLLSICYDLNI